MKLTPQEFGRIPIIGVPIQKFPGQRGRFVLSDWEIVTIIQSVQANTHVLNICQVPSTFHIALF